MLNLARTLISFGAFVAFARPVDVRAEDAARPASSAGDGAGAITVTVPGRRPLPVEPPRAPWLAGSVVHRDELAAPGLEATDVLRRQAGVTVTQAGGVGAPATASIRGATAAQTPVYLAGVRMNDEVAGAADLSQIPLWLIDRVEIYRGNAPIEADDLGIGGAVFFEPRRPGHEEAGAGLTFGSFGRREGFAHAAAGSERTRALVGVDFSAAANDYPFRDDRGTLFTGSDDRTVRQPNADVRTLDGWLVARSAVDSDTTVDLVANATAREQGVPTLALLPSRRARADFERQLVAVRTRSGFGPDRRHVLDLETSFVDAGTRIDDPARELALPGDHLTLDGERLEQRVRARLQLSPELAGDLALDGAIDHLRRDGGEASHLDARVATTRPTGALEWRMGAALTARALFAWQCRALDGRPLCDQGEPTGRVGLDSALGRARIFANAGRYVRHPTLAELYGAGVLVRGNENLKTEVGRTVELGARWQSGPSGAIDVWAEGVAFRRWAERLVGYVRAAQGFVIPINVGQARVSGLELSAGSELFGRVGATVAATLLDPRDTTPGRLLKNDLLPFQSRLVLQPALFAKLPLSGWGAADRLEGRIEWIHQGSRFADAAGTVLLPSQDVVSAELAVAWLGDGVLTRARVENVFDEPRFDIVGYPLPGRSFFVSMEVNWK